MHFTSTRNALSCESARTIAQGISSDGGLFVPVEFPVLSASMIRRLVPMSYKERAVEVLSLFLTDFTRAELERCVSGAYDGTFENNDCAPLKEVSEGMHLLELWHGPTCAFKDMALQLLPFLLTASARKIEPDRTIVILVATSGDTGKAALDGFADVPGTKIIVFFPEHGVSPMQKLQMQTQEGANVAVCGIEGNFDDAQTGVKKIFADPEMKAFLAEHNMEFSSANSINFGRLVPQIVYYVSAYCDLLKNGKCKPGETFNIAVPTGNFGNILAAYYAKRMGIPVGKLICASNKNKILTDFIRTGVYDRNREFYTTISPSMDILISSNLERLLFHLYGNDEKAVKGLMESLNTTGRYQVSPEVLSSIRTQFYAGFCDDEETVATIHRIFQEDHYLCDTHTAVAVSVYQNYRKETGDTRPCVVASTASPFKFAASVLPAVTDDPVPADGFAALEKLSAVTGVKMPQPLASLKDRKVLHTAVAEKTEMSAFIRAFLSK